MTQAGVSRAKLILMNSAVAIALLYKYWKGTPLPVVLLVGAFMFTLVNVVMYFAAQRSAGRTDG